MKKVGKRAKDFAMLHTSNKAVNIADINKAVEELPPEEKSFVLAYEDKQDMALLKRPVHQTHPKATPQCMILLTQAIIESARDEEDEDFFKAGFGAFVVDTYNSALTVHKGHDYEITAGLLLEKMQKGLFQPKGEKYDDEI